MVEFAQADIERNGTMSKLVFAIAGTLLLTATLVGFAEVGEAVQTASPSVAMTGAADEEPVLAVADGDAASAAMWVETGRRLVDTRKPRLPQPRVLTRRR